MKKNVFLLWMLFFAVCCLRGQETEKLRLRHNEVQAGWRSIALKDAYLSPLRYAGSGLNISQKSQSFFLKTSLRWIATSDAEIAAYALLNPARTASMLYLAAQYDYGVHRAFIAGEHWRFLVGTSVNIDVGGKYLARNTNNPVNLDLAANLNASAAMRWRFPLWQRQMQIDLCLRVPLAGLMFVPQNGASYYEMGYFENGLKNTLHPSHLANKHGLRATLGIDIPLKPFTLRLGGNAELLRYKANAALYSRQTAGATAGIVYHFIRFSGNKKQPQTNIFEIP